MKRPLLLLVVSVLISMLYAQELVFKGNVIDNKKQSVAYASIALLTMDETKLITGTISDNQGNFHIGGIKPGSYTISLSFVGYKPLKEKINFTANDSRTFVLEEDALLLDEVTVKANRSNIVKQSAVGQTFMLSETAAKRKDVMEALQEIPSLQIDPGTRQITLADGSNPLILVNGVRKEGGISAISPEDILSVDVLPTSSAEFMREGYTSVVNIKVKKTERKYMVFNGGINTHPLVLFGIADASLEFGNSKYSLYMSGQSFAFLNNKSEMKEWSRTEKSMRSLIYNREADYSDSYFALGGSRNWSEKDYSSFSATIDYLPQISSATGTTLMTDNISGEVDTYRYTRDFNDKLWAGSANVYHKHSFTGSYLDFLLQWSASDNKNKANQLENGVTDLISDFNFHNQRQSIAFTPSYQFTLGGFKSKIGISSYYQYNKILQEEGIRSEFIHKEWNEYAFMDISRTWGSFSLAASLGADAVFRDVAKYKDRFFNLRPVLNMSYKVSGRQSVTFNYSMQATSPDVVQLNPYNTSSDSLTRSIGNPYLKPYQTQRFKLNYIWSGSGFYVEPSMRYESIDNLVGSTGFSENGKYIQTLANQDNSEQWSWGLAFRYTINKVGFVGFNMAYNTIRFPEISQKDDFFSGRVNIGLNYKKFSLSGFYTLPRYVYGMYSKAYSSPESWCTLSYSVSENWDMSVGMRYIGSDNHIERRKEMPGYSYYYDNQFTNRGSIWMLGIRYKFQNRKPVRSHEKLQNEDKGFRLLGE